MPITSRRLLVTGDEAPRSASTLPLPIDLVVALEHGVPATPFPTPSTQQQVVADRCAIPSRYWALR